MTLPFFTFVRSTLQFDMEEFTLNGVANISNHRPKNWYQQSWLDLSLQGSGIMAFFLKIDVLQHPKRSFAATQYLGESCN